MELYNTLYHSALRHTAPLHNTLHHSLDVAVDVAVNVAVNIAVDVAADVAVGVAGFFGDQESSNRFTTLRTTPH